MVNTLFWVLLYFRLNALIHDCGLAFDKSLASMEKTESQGATPWRSSKGSDFMAVNGHLHSIYGQHDITGDTFSQSISGPYQITYIVALVVASVMYVNTHPCYGHSSRQIPESLLTFVCYLDSFFNACAMRRTTFVNTARLSQSLVLVPAEMATIGANSNVLVAHEPGSAFACAILITRVMCQPFHGFNANTSFSLRDFSTTSTPRRCT